MLKLLGDKVVVKSKLGVVESMEHVLQLSLPSDHYYTKSIDHDGQFVRKKAITARGFDYINAIAGVSIVHPDTLTDENGLEVSNPIIRRRSGAVSFVRIRKMAIGRANNGNLRAIDLTLSYDVIAGLASQLFDLWMERGGPAWGRLANGPKSKKLLIENGILGRAAIGGGNWFVYSMNNTDVVRVLQDHASKSTFAGTAAATLVTRNLLRRHFGFEYAQDDGKVAFLSWPQSDLNWKDIDTSSLDVEEMEEVEEVSTDKETTTTPASLISAEVRRVGDVNVCKKATTYVCKKHKIKWGDIGTTDNEEALAAIYAKLKTIESKEDN